MDKPLDYYEAFYDSFGENCEFMIATLNFQDYLKNLQDSYDKIAAELAVLNQKIADGVNSAKVHKQKAQLISKLQLLMFALKKLKN